MAIEYTLYIDTDQNPETVMEQMFAGIGLKPRIEKSGGFASLLRRRPPVFRSTSGPGFITSAYKTSDFGRSLLMEEMEINPGVSIGFRLSKFKDWEPQVRTMLQATLQLLREIPGDAVLLFNGELVWLLRKAGELTLNRRTDLWRPEFLKLVTSPYKMEDIPIL
jgi:hypothetical protein